MLILVVLRRLGLRTRMIVGVVSVAAGLGLVAVPGMLVHGLALLATGVIFCASAASGGRRARSRADGERVPAGVHHDH
ncbi:hypothetical protein [Actinomadura roseirufa]|uniref:hypothetical protein n=1 Tax=Actinomadura roseirufa TaxID=2094049 RepID=UPI0010418563|nr:hypothetical protein [Actinomadura roseirufa]